MPGSGGVQVGERGRGGRRGRGAGRGEREGR